MTSPPIEIIGNLHTRDLVVEGSIHSIIPQYDGIERSALHELW